MPAPARDRSADSITWTAAGMREGGTGACGNRALEMISIGASVMVATGSSTTGFVWGGGAGCSSAPGAAKDANARRQRAARREAGGCIPIGRPSLGLLQAVYQRTAPIIDAEPPGLGFDARWQRDGRI